MTDDPAVAGDTAEDLFEDAPCGYLSTRVDGTIVRVNRTFESWTGLDREALVGHRRVPDLLSAGGRVYWSTHVAPLLHMQGAVRGIAVEVVRADGSRLPALLNADLRAGSDGEARAIRVTVFDATDRRRYEEELLEARRREQGIAQELQRSLLAGALPEAGTLELARAYRPAVQGLEVGGDWFDAFWLDDGTTVGLVVGDVVGRGIPAAATMGQLRSAVRALASTGLSPGPLLDALDGYARRHEVGRMTTLVHARLDLGSGALAYACAGHPPPVVVAPGQAPEVRWDGRSLPLDAHGRGAARRAEARCTLEPGALVLLYTDGLIERRSRSLDVGIDELVTHLDHRRGHDLAALTAGLVRALPDPAHRDDVCLLAARRTVAGA